MGIAECAAATPYSELLIWKHYWRAKANDETDPVTTALHYLTAEVRRSWTKNPHKVKNKDFVIRFEWLDDKRRVRRHKSKEEPELTEEQKQAKIDKSKSAWMAIAGLGPDGKLIVRSPPTKKKE